MMACIALSTAAISERCPPERGAVHAEKGRGACAFAFGDAAGSSAHAASWLNSHMATVRVGIASHRSLHGPHRSQPGGQASSRNEFHRPKIGRLCSGAIVDAGDVCVHLCLEPFQIPEQSTNNSASSCPP